MTLGGSPLLYVFYDVFGLADERATLEGALGLPVIEVEPHQPHERHGVVKYDAGDVILSLNRSTESKFKPYESDALTAVLSVDSGHVDTAKLAESGTLAQHANGMLFTDRSGHHFRLRPGQDEEKPTVAELSLIVDDLDCSVSFYRDLLGLELLDLGVTARFATATVPLVLVPDELASDGRSPQRRTVLIVFHAADVNETSASLRERGLRFDNLRAYFTEIGGTIRFTDPSGHRLCLYEPSQDCLTWGSGPKVLEIVHKSIPV